MHAQDCTQALRRSGSGWLLLRPPPLAAADPTHPPPRHPARQVETKLLDKKVAAVEEQVTNIAKKELHGALPPQLARISKTTALARTSMTGANLGRTSATAIAQQVGGGRWLGSEWSQWCGVCAGLGARWPRAADAGTVRREALGSPRVAMAPPPAYLQVAEIEAALAQPLGGKISAEERQELERRAQAMREAAARLQRVSGELQQRARQGRGLALRLHRCVPAWPPMSPTCLPHPRPFTSPSASVQPCAATRPLAARPPGWTPSSLARTRPKQPVRRTGRRQCMCGAFPPWLRAAAPVPSACERAAVQPAGQLRPQLNTHFADCCMAAA